jgi:hypothetical protein
MTSTPAAGESLTGNTAEFLVTPPGEWKADRAPGGRKP